MQRSAQWKRIFQPYGAQSRTTLGMTTRVHAEKTDRTFRTIFGTQQPHQVSVSELLGSDGGEPRFMSPYFPSLNGDISREALPLMIYVPGIDGVGYAAHKQLERLAAGFQLETFMIPFEDKHDFQSLLQIFTSYVQEMVDPQIPERMVYLLGESFGAVLTLAAAYECKDVVDRVVLVNPATGYDQSVISTVAPLLPNVPEVMYPLVSGLMAPLIANPFNILFGDSQNAMRFVQQPSDLIERGLQMLGTLDLVSNFVTSDIIRWKLDVLRQGLEHIDPYLHKVPQRTLVIASGNDLLLRSREEAERLERVMLRAFVKMVPLAGHAVMEESGTDLLQLLKDEGFYLLKRKMTSEGGHRRRPALNNFGKPFPIEMPPRREIEKMGDVLKESFRFNSPVYFSTLPDGSVVQGMDGIPDDRPILFVGNHPLMALDMKMLVYGLLKDKDILVRGLAHPAVMRESINVVKPPKGEEPTPIEQALIALFNPRDAYKLYTTYGAVSVNPRSAYRLLSHGECVLLYPGGAIEALKLRDQKYEIMWPDNSEFVRMAAKCGATVVTIASVGSEDGVEQLLDNKDMMMIPSIRESMEKFEDESARARRGVTAREKKMKDRPLTPPLTVPIKPARQYFLFGKPIRLVPEIANDDEKCAKFYQHFKIELETNISYLIEKREEDPYKEFERRIVYETLNQRTAPTFKPSPFRNGNLDG